MSTQISWHSDFIEWTHEELKKPPSSRSLSDLLGKYAEIYKKEENPEDWAEENLENILEVIKNENSLVAIADRDDDSPEAYSIRLKEEIPPQEKFIPEARKQENLQPISTDLIVYRIEQLEKRLDANLYSIENLKSDIGSRNNHDSSLFDSIRGHSQKIDSFIEIKSTLIEEIKTAQESLSVLRQDIGYRENHPQSLFSWIRSRDAKIQQLDLISQDIEGIRRNLERHIGSGNFESEAQTFKTHFDHILFALPTGGSKIRGWLGLIVVIVLASLGISMYVVNYTNNINNKLNNLDTEIDQVREDLNDIQNPAGGSSNSQQPPLQNQGNTSSPNSGNSNSATP